MGTSDVLSAKQVPDWAVASIGALLMGIFVGNYVAYFYFQVPRNQTMRWGGPAGIALLLLVHLVAKLMTKTLRLSDTSVIVRSRSRVLQTIELSEISQAAWETHGVKQAAATLTLVHRTGKFAFRVTDYPEVRRLKECFAFIESRLRRGSA